MSPWLWEGRTGSCPHAHPILLLYCVHPRRLAASPAGKGRAGREGGRKEMSVARLPRCARQPPGLPLPPGRRCYCSQLRSGWRHSALLLPGGCQPLGVLFAALREVPEVGWGEGAVGEGVISMQGGVLVSFNVNQQKTCFLGLCLRGLSSFERDGVWVKLNPSVCHCTHGLLLCCVLGWRAGASSAPYCCRCSSFCLEYRSCLQGHREGLIFISGMQPSTQTGEFLR